MSLNETHVKIYTSSWPNRRDANFIVVNDRGTMKTQGTKRNVGPDLLSAGVRRE